MLVYKNVRIVGVCISYFALFFCICSICLKSYFCYCNIFSFSNSGCFWYTEKKLLIAIWTTTIIFWFILFLRLYSISHTTDNYLQAVFNFSLFFYPSLWRIGTTNSVWKKNSRMSLILILLYLSISNYTVFADAASIKQKFFVNAK